MIKFSLAQPESLARDAFPFGSIEILHSDYVGGLVYGGDIVIPRVMPESKIRLRPVAKLKERSPDFTVDVVEIDDEGNAFWATGAGAAWFAEKDGNPRIDMSLNLGVGGAKVNCAAFIADEGDQPKEDDWPEGYDPNKNGPVLWRVSYSPYDKAKAPARKEAAAQLEDSIRF